MSQVRLSSVTFMYSMSRNVSTPSADLSGKFYGDRPGKLLRQVKRKKFNVAILDMSNATSQNDFGYN